ncbi:MAG: MFS transporter [Acidimicrobiales bacterium]|jgi:MFS family permease
MSSPQSALSVEPGPSPLRRFWYRSLDRYPHTGPRVFYLAIVVMTTVLVYYELFAPGAVSPTIISHYGMTFRYYVYATGVISAMVGAFSSIIAGFADRFGRANMVTYGVGASVPLVLFGLPNAPNAISWVVLFCGIGFLEGFILVATPALVRDFSPQFGRSSAMAFWLLGPVIGSEVVTQVSSHTLSHLHPWQDQFTICGVVGLVVFLIALFGLRELSPNLRDQLMVSMRDRVLVEAKAKGIDVRSTTRKPWRQMIRFDIAGPAFGAGTLLFMYSTFVGFLVIFLATTFGYSEQRANALGNWFWAFNAVGLILSGLLSDRLKVRKPFMVFGAMGAMVMSIVWALRTMNPATSYYTFVIIVSLLGFFLSSAYAPWFASLTETIEARNPALTATGLAVAGWVNKITIALMALILPFVVVAMTPIVNFAAQSAPTAAKYASEISTSKAMDAATSRALTANPADPVAGAKAVAEISAKFHTSSASALQRLIALGKATQQKDFRSFLSRAAAVAPSVKHNARDWQHWWWVCLGGQVLFLPFIFMMVGRWRPRNAKRDAEEHDRTIEEELAKLSLRRAG